jgi:hypothetical protein
MIYGSELRPLTTNNLESLRIFERKVLQRIFGPACENGFWRITENYMNYFLNQILLKP